MNKFRKALDHLSKNPPTPEQTNALYDQYHDHLSTMTPEQVEGYKSQYPNLANVLDIVKSRLTTEQQQKNIIFNVALTNKQP